MNFAVNEFLMGLELKGKLLRDMQAVIKTGQDLESFKSFILVNDGKFKSKLQLVSMYIRHLQNKTQKTEHQFASDYNNAKTSVEKREVLSSLLCRDVDTVVVNKIDKIVSNGLTLEYLYDKLREYQNSLNPNNIVDMILSSIEEEKIIK